MSAAPPTAEPTTQPDPNTAGAASKESRTGCLLHLLRRLIDYGKELAAALQRHGPLASATALHGHSFGTRDIALILARIARGLHLADALEARLVQNAARLDAGPKPCAAAAAPRKPRRATPAAQHDDAADAAPLPTPEQIAAMVRRRPIGAVIADVCRDLGVLPNHPLWRELSRAIIRHGGSLARLVSDILERPSPLLLAGQSADVSPAQPPAFAPFLANPATRPP